MEEDVVVDVDAMVVVGWVGVEGVEGVVSVSGASARGPRRGVIGVRRGVDGRFGGSSMGRMMGDEYGERADEVVVVVLRGGLCGAPFAVDAVGAVVDVVAAEVDAVVPVPVLSVAACDDDDDRLDASLLASSRKLPSSSISATTTPDLCTNCVCL